MSSSAPDQTFFKASNKLLVRSIASNCVQELQYITGLSLTFGTFLDSPAKITLFNEIAAHVSNQLHSNGEPAHKKRKVEAGSNGVTGSGVNPAEEKVLLEVKEISVSVPQRKKFELCFTEQHLYARVPGTTTPAPGIVYAWKDIGKYLAVATVLSNFG